MYESFIDSKNTSYYIYQARRPRVTYVNDVPTSHINSRPLSQLA